MLSSGGADIVGQSEGTRINNSPFPTPLEGPSKQKKEHKAKTTTCIQPSIPSFYALHFSLFFLFPRWSFNGSLCDPNEGQKKFFF